MVFIDIIYDTYVSNFNYFSFYWPNYIFVRKHN